MPRGSNWIVTPDKFLSPQQVKLLRDHAELERGRAIHDGDRKVVRDAGIVETLLGTGLRVSELCALKVGDLFLEDGRADVFVRRGKGAKARIVAIPTRLRDYLASFVSWKMTVGESVEAAAPLFVSQRWGHLTGSGVWRVWKGALQRAGLPVRWGVHATRHTYAVEVYRRTRDLRLAQRQLGHASVTTTTIYANLLDEDLRRGVEQVWA